MKKIFKEILIGAAILLVVSNMMSYLRKPNLKDDALPSMVSQTIKGEPIDMSKYRGKPLLIHFWATWCPVCKMEMGNIEQVSKKYQVITVAVSSESDAQIKAFMQDHQSDFDVINDEKGEISRSFAVEAFPTTFIYDGNGTLKFTEVGYTTTAGLLARMAYVE